MYFRLLLLILTTSSVDCVKVELKRHFFTNEPCARDLFRCDNARCIRKHYRCDNDNDCGDGSDETQCSIPLTNFTRFERFEQIKKRAENFLIQQRKNDSRTERWGYYATRTAVALYLANETYFGLNNTIGKELAFEVVYRLLSRLALNELDDVKDSELASFINAFLVTCIDVRSFQGINLVQELRSRVNKQDYVNPFVMIALCNAGDNITEVDVEKIKSAFSNAHRELWTDVQALAVMAMACALHRNQSLRANLSEMTLALKRRQTVSSISKNNGITDNLKTTGLILQALIAANDSLEDTDHYSALKALMAIVDNQNPADGSFDGDVVKTYFTLPIFNYKSLVDINSSHCLFRQRDGQEILQDWLFQTGDKNRVKYSLWLGSDRYLEKTMQLYVPANTPFFKIMQVSAKLDPMFKFEHTMKSYKPYVYSVANIEDDPENGKFWFLYSVSGDSGNVTATLINASPLEYIPRNNEHVVLWYKRAHWSME